MMNLFRRYILGGISDKTEGTLLAFLIGVGWVTYALVQSARGHEMAAAWDFLTLYMMTVVVAFTGATVVGYLKPRAGGSVLPGDGQVAGGVGGWVPPVEMPVGGQKTGELE